MVKLKEHINKHIIFVLICLLSFYPYNFNMFLGLPSETILLVGLATLTYILVFAAKKDPFSHTLPNWITTCFVLQIVTWSFYFVIHTDSSYITRILLILFASGLLVLLNKKNLLFKFAEYYNYFILLQAALGLPAFILYALGLLPTLYTFVNESGREVYFLGLTFSNAITGGICRVAGFFDEPGALAFWGIYALLLNKLIFNNKLVEVFLSVCLLTTVSAAYFIQITLYVFAFYTRSVKHIFLMVLIAGSLFVVTYKYLGDNAQIAYMTIERFEGGEIRSKRSDYSEIAKKIFSDYPIFGSGAKRFQEIGADDNPYEIPAKDGIIGFIVTYLPLLYMLFKYGRRNKDIFFASLILFAGYMQRPFHINLLHFFVLYLFTLLVYYKKKGYV